MISDQRLEDFVSGKIPDEDLTEAEVLDLQERVIIAILDKKMQMHSGLIFQLHDTLQ